MVWASADETASKRESQASAVTERDREKDRSLSRSAATSLMNFEERLDDVFIVRNWAGLVFMLLGLRWVSVKTGIKSVCLNQLQRSACEIARHHGSVYGIRSFIQA